MGGTKMALGRFLIGAGLCLVILGAALLFLGKWNIIPGRLPGDLVWRGRNSTVYFPVVTCVLLSVIGSFLLWLLNRRS